MKSGINMADQMKQNRGKATSGGWRIHVRSTATRSFIVSAAGNSRTSSGPKF
jgi:hypothetical protein